MRRIGAITTLFWFLLSTGTSAQDSSEAAWQAFRTPGAVAIMRHALAPGTGDPEVVRIGDCATQRNLDDAGQDQARRIGAALRARGLSFDAVLTSQWCRCRETAALLGLGDPEDLPSLNSFYEDWGAADQRTADTRAYLRKHAATKRLFLVSHQVNISALTGAFTQSGEILIVRFDKDGKAEILGAIHIPAE